MLRSVLGVLLCTLVLGCATPPKAVRMLAKAEPNEASLELECMADCLDDSDVSCEECAARCFKPPQGVIVTLAR